MPKTIRNQYDKYLTYENLMRCHKKCKQGKGARENVIRFDFRREEYIMYLYKALKEQTYKHGSYKTFYVYEPKLRMIEASKYIDRIVHRWYVDYFLLPNFVPQFIPTTYACIKDRGMHYSALDLQQAMKKAKKQWGEYYILKMDVKKYFQSINKDVLLKILEKKIKDEKIMWLTREIIFSKRDTVRNPYWKL